jgi:hypothetical protein
MLCYKDQTFCHNWCGNINCFRNYIHTKDAGEILVMFFVSKPIDCEIWKPLEEKK